MVQIIQGLDYHAKDRRELMYNPRAASIATLRRKKSRSISASKSPVLNTKRSNATLKGNPSVNHLKANSSIARFKSIERNNVLDSDGEV